MNLNQKIAENNEMSEPQTLAAQRALFALWLYVTTNNPFIGITPQPSATTRIDQGATAEELNSLTQALLPLASGAAEGEAPGLINRLLSNLFGQWLAKEFYSTPLPVQLADSGETVNANINYGTALIAIRGLCQSLAKGDVLPGLVLYPGGIICDDVADIVSIVPDTAAAQDEFARS